MSGFAVAYPAWSPEEERARLEEVSQWYDSRVGINRDLGRAAAARICRRAHGARALELGCASGVVTEKLVASFPHVDVVDSAARYAQRARCLLAGKGKAYHCLFEEFEPSGRYDAIIMTWILEHVADPHALLSRAAGWLAPQGEIHIVVPNAESLHRRVGLRMGLLSRLDQLNSSDLAIGHRRVYTWDSLTADVTGAGLTVISIDGILLKPLPSALMESWPPDLRAAFFELSDLTPRLCSEIHAVCG